MNGSPRTLFVGRQRMAVAWYRCALPAEFLGADWIAIDDRGPELRQVAGKDGVTIAPEDWSSYDVVVVQQPRGAAWVRRIRELQATGTVVLFEIDDYMHAVRKAADHDFRHVEDRKVVQGLELAMRVADGLICSTDWLARRYRTFNDRVYVCRNGLDLGRYAMTRPRRAAPVIGWAGATGHKQAVAPWLDAVADVMRERPEVGFVSIGQPFHETVAAQVGGDRCTGIPFTTLEAYPAAMTLMDIAIAPAGKSNFFRGKSDLRFLEAGALGIATIADPDVYPTLRHGVTGLHASTPAEARAHLLALVDDSELRERLGTAAREYVRGERDMRVMSGQWAAVLFDVMGSDDPAKRPVPRVSMPAAV
jgi:glycosyltransferase involved in cell wall biosynthesis